MRGILRTLILTTAIAGSAGAQKFGEWMPPVNLGAAVNSTAADGCPNISKTGLTLFFASTRAGGSGGFDIYMSRRDAVDGEWGPPENLGSAVNSTGNEICPALSLDERHLYFVSDRSGGCGNQDLYMSERPNKRDPHGWQPAVNLGCTINSPADDFGPAYFEDDDTGEGTIFFSSTRPNGKGGADLYRSVRGFDGTFAAAILIDELSTPFDDARPAIRKDGLEMFFDTTRPGGMGGPDLWVTTRDSVGETWSEPEWIPNINSTGSEVRPSLSFDGRSLYFTSNRSGGSGAADIWMATREHLVRHDADRRLGDRVN